MVSAYFEGGEFIYGVYFTFWNHLRSKKSTMAAISPEETTPKALIATQSCAIHGFCIFWGWLVHLWSAFYILKAFWVSECKIKCMQYMLDAYFKGGESIYDVHFAFWEHLGCKIAKSNMAATERGTKAMEVTATLSCTINICCIFWGRWFLSWQVFHILKSPWDVKCKHSSHLVLFTIHVHIFLILNVP